MQTLKDRCIAAREIGNDLAVNIGFDTSFMPRPNTQVLEGQSPDRMLYNCTTGEFMRVNPLAYISEAQKKAHH